MLEGRDVPSTLTVNNTLDSGKGSLRYEIARAAKNDTIVFAPSLDGSTITLTSGQLNIATGLTIKGPGAGQLTISGGNHSRVFEVNANAPVVLSGLTISNGTAAQPNAALPYDYDGGGILNLSTLTLTGCIVSGNSASAPAPSYGGGIYNAGTLTLTGCSVSNNTANADNAPAAGGGIYNSGTLTITNSTLSGNETNGIGGGIYNAGTLTVSSSTFQAPRPGANANFPDNIYGPYTDGGGNIFG
jgi:hypothetical protein